MPSNKKGKTTKQRLTLSQVGLKVKYENGRMKDNGSKKEEMEKENGGESVLEFTVHGLVVPYLHAEP